MSKPNDAHLVAETLSGKPEAFTALVRKHQNYAYGTAIGMVSDFDLAQDIVQEAFLIAYQDLNKLKKTEHFGLWLRGIVRNTARNALKEIERVRAIAQEIKHTAPSAVQSPDHADPETERRLMVHHALARLNDKNREVVSLHYVSRLSYADIAQFLNTTETAVQGRLQRARMQLREEITMVKEQFESQGLPDDFAQEIQQLLEQTNEKDKREWDAAIDRLSEMGIPAVEPLCEALGDSRREIRHLAAFALSAIGDSRAIQPLLHLLYSKYIYPLMNRHKRRMGEFLNIQGMREKLIEHLNEDRITGDTFFVLEHAKGDQEILEAMLGHYDRTHSRSALYTIYLFDPQKGLELVTEALQSSDAYERMGGIDTAFRNDMRPPLDACITAFVNSANENLGLKAHRGIKALRLIERHGAEGESALKNLLQSDDPEVRVFTAVANSTKETPESFSIMTEAFLTTQKDQRWKSKLWRTLGEFQSNALADWIIQQGDQLSDIPAPLWALSLSQSKHENVIPTIEHLLEIGLPSVKEACVKILANQKGAKSMSFLRQCLAKGKPTRVARRAFFEMDALREQALPTVQQMFTSDLWTERRSAACLLKRWKKLTPEQHTQIENDPHIGVQKALTR